MGQAQPTDLAFLPGGRALVTTKTGNIWLFADNAMHSLGSIPNVHPSGERGLLSIAADPGFTRNGYVYVYYLHTAGHGRLERFTCTGDLASPNSATLAMSAASGRLIIGPLPDATPHHKGGSLRFGPDGMLFMSIGDDGNPCDAQDVHSQRGCLLRMDVSGLSPAARQTAPTYLEVDPGDNPMSGDNGFCSLLIAHGLRNPFRMEIDPQSGDIFLGDVGADLEEELSVYSYSRGALKLTNFGWPWREGLTAGPYACSGTPPAGMRDPITTELNGAADSIMAGALYRNGGGSFDFGSEYEGNLFYMDWFQGYTRRIAPGPAGAWGPAAAAAGQPSPSNWAQLMPWSAALRQGPDGALWFVENAFWAQPEARLARLRPTNLPTRSVTAVSGGTQIGAAASTFAAPFIVEVRDANGQPVAGASVGVEVLGPAELISHPLHTSDANGRVSINVRALDQSGPITVLASTPGASSRAVAEMFSRRLSVTTTPSQLEVRVDNATGATPANVYYFVTMSLGASAPMITPIGTLNINPYDPTNLVIEDATGLFNFVSYSGLGGVGDPSLVRTYLLPPGLLTGFTAKIEAAGFDALTGWFVTNLAVASF